MSFVPKLCNIFFSENEVFTLFHIFILQLLLLLYKIIHFDDSVILGIIRKEKKIRKMGRIFKY